MPARRSSHANRLGRAADDPVILRRVAALLAERWDPDRDFTAPDGTRAPSAHATAVVGIYAAGGSSAEVMGYLRRAEEAALGVARTTGHERGPIVQDIREIMLADPYADEVLPPTLALVTVERELEGSRSPMEVTVKKKGPRSVPDFSRHPTAPAKASAPTPEQKSAKARNDAARPQTRPQTGTSKSGQRGK